MSTKKTVVARDPQELAAALGLSAVSREQHDDENGRQHAKQDDADDRRPGRRLSAGSSRRLRLERGIRLIGHVFPPTCDVAGHSSVPKEPRDPLMQSLDPRTPPGQELR